MRTVSRITAAAVAGAALFTLSLSTAAQAAKPGPPPPTVVTVGDVESYEYVKFCSTSSPYACGTRDGSVTLVIQVTNRPPNTTVTVGYQLVDVTTTAGQDYTGATSGTVSILPTAAQGYVTVPIVNDGVAEPTETFQVRLTSSSVPADISDTAVGTIRDGGQIPPDCDLASSDSLTRSLTCTNRPAAQRWHLYMYCINWVNVEDTVGNIVTGNGTSTARCPSGLNPSYPYFIIDP